MQASGLEFVTLHAKALNKYALHQSGFLLLRVGSAGLEVKILTLGFDSPCAHCKAELNIGFNLACMSSTVEQAEFHGAFREESVEVDSVVTGFIVMLMVNCAGVGMTSDYVLRGIPDSLQLVL